jgi:hypothetical protein
MAPAAIEIVVISPLRTENGAPASAHRSRFGSKPTRSASISASFRSNVIATGVKSTRFAPAST